MSEVRFSALIEAEPQGSVRAFVVKGRAVLTSDNPHLNAYRKTLAAIAAGAMVRAGIERPMAGKHVGVAVAIQFTFVKPASVKRRPEMSVRPDVDKCLRSTLDALTGILWLDDAQVVEVTARKLYGPTEKVEIHARILESDLVPVTGSLALQEDF